MPQNPWSLIPELAQAGQFALATGQVTPEEAMENFRQVSPLLKQLGVGQGGAIARVLASKGKPQPQTKGKAAKVPLASSKNTPTEDPSVYKKQPVAAPATETQQTGDLDVSVDQVAKGSGLTNEAGAKAGVTEEDLEKILNKTVAQRAQMLTPEQVQEAFGAAENIPDIQSQREGINRMERMLDMTSRLPTNPYSGPIAGLLQAEFGRDTSVMAAQAAQQSPAAAIERIREMQKDVQSARGNLSQRIADLIGKQKAGSITETEQKETMTKLKEYLDRFTKKKAEDPNKATRASTMPLGSRAFRDVQGKFNKEIAPFNQSLKFSEQVESLVKNTGPGAKLAPKQVEALLARARSEVGNLSQYEQAGTTVPPDLLSRLEQKLETLSTGEFTADTKREILGLVSQYKQLSKKAIQNIRSIHAKQGAAAYGQIGLGEADFNKALPALDSSVKDEPPAGSGGLSETEKKRLEELRKKYKNQ